MTILEAIVKGGKSAKYYRTGTSWEHLRAQGTVVGFTDDEEGRIFFYDRDHDTGFWIANFDGLELDFNDLTADDWEYTE